MPYCIFEKMTDAKETRFMGAERPAGKKCPLIAFNTAAGGKYKMRILWELKEGPRRYGELRRSAIVAARGAPVTPRVLSRELKELQMRGLIHRKQYPVVPPKVEYRLTALGKSLIPVVSHVVKWGLSAGQQVASRQGHAV